MSLKSIIGGFVQVPKAGQTAEQVQALIDAIHGGTYSTTATAAGLTTLTVASNYVQRFTGVTTQTVRLPVTSTLPRTGFSFVIWNDSSGAITVQNADADGVIVVPGNSAEVVFCTAIDAEEWSAKQVAGAVSNTAYDESTWNDVTTIAPSKNAVRDKFVSVDVAIDGVARKLVNATAHGFVVGDVLRMDGTAYVKAQSDSDTNAEAIGMVASVTDANNFILATGGFVSGLSGLTAGATYFLSPTTAGSITATEPSTDGQISKPVFIATTTTAGYFFNMRGSEVGGSGATGGIIGMAVITIDNGDAVTVDYADGIFTGAGAPEFAYSSASGVLTVTYTSGGGAQNFPCITWESSASLTASVGALSESGFTANFLDSTTGLAAGTAVDVVRISVAKLSQ